MLLPRKLLPRMKVSERERIVYGGERGWESWGIREVFQRKVKASCSSLSLSYHASLSLSLITPLSLSFLFLPSSCSLSLSPSSFMHTNRARLRANFSSCLFHSVSTSSSSSSTFHTFTHCLSLPQTNSHSLSHDLRSVATPLSRTIYHYAISYTSTLTRINSLSLSLYLTHTLPCPHVVSVFSIAACCCCCYRICLCVLLAIQRKEQGKQVNKTGQKKERKKYKRSSSKIIAFYVRL